MKDNNLSFEQLRARATKGLRSLAYDESGGYDCMYGAYEIGPVELDLRNYGQLPCGDDSIARASAFADAEAITRLLNVFVHSNGLQVLRDAESVLRANNYLVEGSALAQLIAQLDGKE